MMHEPDGVAEEVEQLLQRGGQAAAEVARNRALRRAQELHERARESEQRTREAQARFEAERQAARAQLAGVEHEHWWEHASAREIVDAWGTAQQWREHDPLADRASTHMRAEMIERFGVDPLRVGEEPQTASDPPDTGHYAAHDVTAEEVRSWDAEVEQPGPVGERGRELQATLAELRESRRLGEAAGQATVADTVRQGAPQRPPRARRGRGGPQLGAERERGR
ncbi:hypothetical protein [Conexibacter sp. DBS9H8]|uniref:hypothetical protein n=1 Tax=Conexibacter sp. DBS9H8 TaxID=2937801 RepID=UPI0020100FBD|nr:hypothetical protein [Conexibacter sp. DBS9H8]